MGRTRNRPPRVFTAAFIAARDDPTIKLCQKRLQEAGKPVNVAITACARKPLTILNASAKKGENYMKQAR